MKRPHAPVTHAELMARLNFTPKELAAIRKETARIIATERQKRKTKRSA